MRVQFSYVKVEMFGLGVSIVYKPGVAFNLEALLWNRRLVLGVARD